MKSNTYYKVKNQKGDIEIISIEDIIERKYNGEKLNTIGIHSHETVFTEKDVDRIIDYLKNTSYDSPVGIRMDNTEEVKCYVEQCIKESFIKMLDTP